MKKGSRALTLLSLIGIVALLFLTILYLIGYRFIIPNHTIQPDWEVIQAISTIALSIATLWLTWNIARRQEQISEKQDKLKSEEEAKRFQMQQDIASKELLARELELKVQLYDKRYKVYECFNKYPFPIIEAYARAGRNIILEDQNGPQAMSMTIFNGSFINGRQKIISELQILNEKKNLTSAEKTRRFTLLQRLQVENLDFINSEKAIIDQAE
ncbi:MAG: hypothetical protein ACOYIR_05640 [Christensenellales bacterium]|jgi:membrane protein implicated in regulation of membrane protease activity